MPYHSDSSPGLVLRSWELFKLAWRRVNGWLDAILAGWRKILAIAGIVAAVVWVLYRIDLMEWMRSHIAPTPPCHRSVQPLWNTFKAKLAEVKAANPKEQNEIALHDIAFREGLLGTKVCLLLPALEDSLAKDIHGVQYALFMSRADGKPFIVAVPGKDFGPLKAHQEMRIEGRLGRMIDEDGIVFVVAGKIGAPW
jgi:hypothetical protein